MRLIDIYKDVMYFRKASQEFYNECMLTLRNPEARQLFSSLRDDESRAVAMLQQKIDTMESSPGIIAKIIPSFGDGRE